QAGLVILGDLSIQGNIKSVRSLAEPLQVAMENGARRALVPLENKRNFLEVSGEIVERVDPIFFSDPMTAAMKALGMTGVAYLACSAGSDQPGWSGTRTLKRSCWSPELLRALSPSNSFLSGRCPMLLREKRPLAIGVPHAGENTLCHDRLTE